MGFADTLLSTGERIIHREKQHWFVFVWGARFTILAIVVAIILFWLREQRPRAPTGSAAASASSSAGWSSRIFVAGLVVLGWTTLHYINQEYVITNRRVHAGRRRPQQALGRQLAREDQRRAS